MIYRVIHKSIRGFRPLRYSSRDGHAEGEHVNRGTDTPSFCPTLQVLDMSTLLCLSWLLPSWFRTFRRDLWITLYNCALGGCNKNKKQTTNNKRCAVQALKQQWQLLFSEATTPVRRFTQPPVQSSQGTLSPGVNRPGHPAPPPPFPPTNTVRSHTSTTTRSPKVCTGSSLLT